MNTEKIPAVILCLGAAGLGIARSLGRHGVAVYALDTDPKQFGLFSRYCEKRICPDPHESEEQLLSEILNLGQQLGRAVLYPTSDDFVLFVSKHRDVLSKYYVFLMPSHELIQEAVSKRGLYELAIEHGVPVAKAFFPENLDEIHSVSRQINYPCIIKPNHSLNWRRASMSAIVGNSKVLLAHSPDELVSLYKEVAKIDNALMIQEIIGGSDNLLYYFVSYLNQDSEPLAIFAGRKLRVLPVYFGSGSFVQSVWEPELNKNSLALLQGMGYKGLSGVEFKKDPKDGQYKIIEINARFGLWDALGAKCGVDVALTSYKDAIGEPVQPIMSYETGVKWLYWRRDVYAYKGYKQNGDISWFKWLKSLWGKKQYAIFAMDDPMPAIYSGLNFWRAKFLK